jgi:hypothetical protein
MACPIEDHRFQIGRNLTQWSSDHRVQRGPWLAFNEFDKADA